MKLYGAYNGIHNFTLHFINRLSNFQMPKSAAERAAEYRRRQNAKGEAYRRRDAQRKHAKYVPRSDMDKEQVSCPFVLDFVSRPTFINDKYSHNES